MGRGVNGGMDEANSAGKAGQAWVRPWGDWGGGQESSPGAGALGKGGGEGREEMSAPGEGLCLCLAWRGAWGPALGSPLVPLFLESPHARGSRLSEKGQ